MILRLSTSAERFVVLAVAILLAAFLWFFSIRGAAAAHFASATSAAGLQRATRLEPGNAEYWYLLGRYWQFNLEDPDNDKAIKAYRNSLSFDPHSAETYIDLATAYEGLDDIANARENFLKAKKAYPLSAEVSWRVGNFYLRQGELELAFAQIRASVEADPSRGAEAFSRCLRLEPNLKTVLALALPENPAVYLEIIHDLSDEQRTTEALIIWDRLVDLQPSFGLVEVYPLINALREKHEIVDAARVWKQAVGFAGMDQLGDPPGSVLWNGGFESGFHNSGYAWFYNNNMRSVQVQLDSKEKHSGAESLRLTFDGTSDITFADVCHPAPVLPLVNYRLSAWIATRDLSTDEGLRLRIQAFGPGSGPAFTSELHGTASWTEVEIPWSADAGVNEAQVCIARLPSDQPDNRIRGTAWVDDVALIPETASPARPASPKPPGRAKP
ncbi:MAG: tetratricopeptide repeat protein [Candidatus Acidiferrum sp.]|jgi:tetratricopeptide (TPR) repeat protein